MNMNDLFKDFKILFFAGKMMKCLYFIRAALTVAIIVFTVLETGKYFSSGKQFLSK